MVSAALLSVAGVQLACVTLLRARFTPTAATRLLGVVGLGLAYDSAVFGLGAMLGEGALLHALSVGRFIAHALLTPLLVLWAADRVAASPRWRTAAVALTLVLMVWGVAAELPHLRLIPRRFADTLRYVPETPAGPPIPALVVSAVLVAAGILLWRTRRRPWLLLGTVVMVVAAGAAVAFPPLGNAGEAVLLLAMGIRAIPIREARSGFDRAE